MKKRVVKMAFYVVGGLIIDIVVWIYLPWGKESNTDLEREADLRERYL